jgi:hypothetical protein
VSFLLDVMVDGEVKVYVVLFSEFFAERCGHDVASCGGLGAEVKFAGLAP